MSHSTNRKTQIEANRRNTSRYSLPTLKLLLQTKYPESHLFPRRKKWQEHLGNSFWTQGFIYLKDHSAMISPSTETSFTSEQIQMEHASHIRQPCDSQSYTPKTVFKLLNKCLIFSGAEPLQHPLTQRELALFSSSRVRRLLFRCLNKNLGV